MKYLFLICLLLGASSVSAFGSALTESNYKSVKENIGKGKPTFLQFGAKQCPGCISMGKTLSRVIKNHPNYNVKYIDVHMDEEVIDDYNIMMVPMQVIHDKNGKKVYENIGLMDEDNLKQLFKKYNF